NEGYCGADTEELVKTHYQNDNRAYFEAKYQKVNNTYIIKGYKMPDTHNPFLKIQKYCINVIKAAMTLFIVVYFYKQLLTGKIGDLAKQESLMKLVFLAFKFSVVATLIFYNGWQNGIYQRLVNFSTSGYEFINSIFLEITKNPLNQILNLDDNIIIRVARVEGTESTANILCFRYNAFREIDYALVDPVTRACPRWYRRKNLSEIIVQQNNDFPKQNGNKLIISRNQEISRLLYFVDKHNETSPVEDRIEILGVGDIWSNRYDGCYFDTTEYPKNKSYLSIFDTLDCKFVNYLGFSANDGAPNILILSLIMLVPNLILPDSILTKVVGFLGSALFGAILTFLFVMFNLMIKVVYMFTSATFTISILVFVSPIVLPLMFFERTKKSYETWFGMVIDTTLKPMLNISFVILYINILDKILFKGITFSKHSNIGRGPNLECIEDTPTFLCYITNPFSPAYVRIIFSSMILTLGMNLLIAYLLFHLADEFLGQLEEVSNSLFEFGGSADTTKANFKSEGVVGNAAKSASETGAAIEEFRQNYLDKIPGTLYGKIADSESAKSNKGVGRIAAAVRTLKYGKQGTLGERGFTGTDAIRDCLGNKIAKLGKWANLSNRMENAKDKAHNKLGRPYLKRKEGVAELRNQSIKIAEQKKKIQNLMRKEKTKEDKERKKEDDEIKELRDELRKNEEKLKKLSVYEERKKKKLEKKIRDIRNKEEKLNKKNEEERENRRKEYVAKLNKMRGEMLKMRKKKKEGEILSKYKAGADSDDYWEGKGTSDVDDYYDDIESESTPEKRLEYLKRKRKEREEEILDHLSKMGVLEAINEEIKKENKDKEKKKEKKMSSKEEEEYRKKRIEEAKKEYELENEYNDALRKMRKK
ncbi:MAG: type IV secretion system protein, partial [Rickettsiales bacterium]|nr:type IV secretion system protein [Rickettsiales bacterium]